MLEWQKSDISVLMGRAKLPRGLNRLCLREDRDERIRCALTASACLASASPQARAATPMHLTRGGKEAKVRWSGTDPDMRAARASHERAFEKDNGTKGARQRPTPPRGGRSINESHGRQAAIRLSTQSTVVVLKKEGYVSKGALFRPGNIRAVQGPEGYWVANNLFFSRRASHQPRPQGQRAAHRSGTARPEMARQDAGALATARGGPGFVGTVSHRDGDDKGIGRSARVGHEDSVVQCGKRRARGAPIR